MKLKLTLDSEQEWLTSPIIFEVKMYLALCVKIVIATLVNIYTYGDISLFAKLIQISHDPHWRGEGAQ